MELTGLRRSRISRDTRLLLITVCIAVAALWVLARLRFPDRPATANPIPPLLTQLAPRAARMRSMRRIVAGRNVFISASDILEGLESLWTRPLYYAARTSGDTSVP